MKMGRVGVGVGVLVAVGVSSCQMKTMTLQLFVVLMIVVYGYYRWSGSRTVSIICEPVFSCFNHLTLICVCVAIMDTVLTVLTVVVVYLHNGKTNRGRRSRLDSNKVA